MDSSGSLPANPYHGPYWYDNAKSFKKVKDNLSEVKKTLSKYSPLCEVTT